MPKGTVTPGQVIHTMGFPLSKASVELSSIRSLMIKLCWVLLFIWTLETSIGSSQRIAESKDP